MFQQPNGYYGFQARPKTKNRFRITGYLSRRMITTISAIFFFTALVILVISIPSHRKSASETSTTFNGFRRNQRPHGLWGGRHQTYPPPPPPPSLRDRHHKQKLLEYTSPGELSYGKKGKKLAYHPGSERNSFVMDDAWRPHDAYGAAHKRQSTQLIESLRPEQRPLNDYPSRSEFLKQTLVSDYAQGAENMFLMIKTGATVLWNRLPIHAATTLTRVPYFGLYADQSSSLAGYEVVDTLANVSETTRKSEQFKLYRELQRLRNTHAIVDPGHTPLTGGWDLDKFKNLPMLEHAWKTAPKHVRWFVFMDGDSYIMLDNLLDYLNMLDHTKPYYIGNHQVIEDQPFAHGGSGVVLSRAAMNMTFGTYEGLAREYEAQTLDVCCGDFMVAAMLKKFDVGLLTVQDDWNDFWKQGDTYDSWWRRNLERREREEYEAGSRIFQGSNRVGQKFTKFPHWDLAIKRSEWCNKAVSFHHLSSMDVEILWEYERLLSPEQKRHITYADIYRDFVAPYIEPFMPGWNSMARTKEYSKQSFLEALEKLRQERADKELKLQNGETIDEEEALRQKKDEIVGDDEDIDSGKHPWNSPYLCQQKCLDDPYCLSWRYLPEESYCANDDAVRLGRPALDYLKYDEEEAGRKLGGAVSGYMIDRIRRIRRTKDCDVLGPDSASIAAYREKAKQREKRYSVLDKKAQETAIAAGLNVYTPPARAEDPEAMYKVERQRVLDSSSKANIAALENALAVIRAVGKEDDTTSNKGISQKDRYEGWYLRARIANRIDEERERSKRDVDERLHRGEAVYGNALSEEEAYLFNDRSRHIDGLKEVYMREMNGTV
ncbi:uncharacterized protein SAPINGB_P002302 [Magnusiomyces paraingens]|uniref:N-acetylgalactosaminide beta-1,3-galactosyltransferase n=1 Tax=Magnusiomyces paraingens TaxID=2606893 RepID=A0A5E8BD78_9ASCO|nr:uncharacterized protein SAPINGB_P002302 [Saprochaete ingens]VVT49504.1 unnamed protein product [Saprochaete ingens]